MGRREIGEHLGLTMETVSRILSHFQSSGWIRLPPHEVEIRSAEMLRAAMLAPAPPRAAQPHATESG